MTDSLMLLVAVLLLLLLGACLWANISFNLFFVWYHPCSRCRLVCLSVLLPLVLLTILWPRFFLYQLPWTGLCYSYFFLELCGKSGVVVALVHNSFMAECVARVFLISRCLGKKEGVISGTASGARKKAGRVGREREKRSSSKFKLEIKLHPFHKKGVIKACSHRLQLHQRTSQKNDINYWI